MVMKGWSQLRKLCSKCRSPSLAEGEFHKLHYGRKCGRGIRIAPQCPGARNVTFLYFSKIKSNQTFNFLISKVGKKSNIIITRFLCSDPWTFIGPGMWRNLIPRPGGCHGDHCSCCCPTCQPLSVSQGRRTLGVSRSDFLVLCSCLH